MTVLCCHCRSFSFREVLEILDGGQYGILNRGFYKGSHNEIREGCPVNGRVIVWPDPALLSAMPLSSGFSPVMSWNRELKCFTDVQTTTDDGLPVWGADAWLRMGWQPHADTVQLRIAAPRKPAVQPDPARIADFFAPRRSDAEH